IKGGRSMRRIPLAHFPITSSERIFTSPRRGEVGKCARGAHIPGEGLRSLLPGHFPLTRPPPCPPPHAGAGREGGALSPAARGEGGGGTGFDSTISKFGRALALIFGGLATALQMQEPARAAGVAAAPPIFIAQAAAPQPRSDASARTVDDVFRDFATEWVRT